MHRCEIFADDKILDRIYDDLENGGEYPWPEQYLHTDIQSTNSKAWELMSELVEEATRDSVEVFSPINSFGWDLWSQIIALPKSVGNLRSVKKLDLYGSNLLSIPPEIGHMTNLEEFAPYTSYGLHWFSYEITRCKKLKASSAIS